jgi:dephospho-CoA kinase
VTEAFFTTQEEIMIKIGVTGGFGSGKSTIARMFKRCGAKVINADALVHKLLKGDIGCQRSIRKVFGKGVMAPRGIDRSKLAAIVFADPKALRKLEAIVHPLVWRETGKALTGFRGAKAVVIDAPLLIEAGWHGQVDVLVVVSAKPAQQVRRIGTRTGLSRPEVQRRIRRQMPLKDKIKHADFVVDNSGTRAGSYRQVQKIWEILTLVHHQEEK